MSVDKYDVVIVGSGAAGLMKQENADVEFWFLTTLITRTPEFALSVLSGISIEKIV